MMFPDLSYSFEKTLEKVSDRVSAVKCRNRYGVLRESIGPLVRVTLDSARIGDLCDLVDADQGRKVPAEVVAVRDKDALLSPYGSAVGLSVQTKVIPRNEPLKVPVGNDLLGKTIDAYGRPLDGSALDLSKYKMWSVRKDTTNPIDRPLIDKVCMTGIRVIDSMTTTGHGQRIGIFGEPGCGKSVLMSMIARNVEADVCVIGLIGERGREVREFLDRQLPAKFRSRCVTVVSTSDRPSMERVVGAYTATTVAEYFRDQGKNVLLLVDSVTRYARALREVGLATGEPPARKGFPPSVFSELPKLLERSGRTNKGSITAFYTVLIEGDALGDPISEEVRSLTDGHIVLSKTKAQAGEYPAIDVLDSKSRVMDELVSDQHKKAASHVRSLLQKYNEVELLLQVGEYKSGSDGLADEAIRLRPNIQKLFQQGANENTVFQTTQNLLFKLGPTMKQSPVNAGQRVQKQR
ncbi:MAG: FliI/YscN family ATPase [Pseudomonadota bacterium]